jgi:hypothetical protein
MKSINLGLLERDYAELSNYQQFFAKSAVEPRLDDERALANGRMPASLARDIERHDGVRLDNGKDSAPGAAQAGGSSNEQSGAS